MDAQHTWKTALYQLAEKIPQSAFNLWVRDTHVVSYEDGVFKIAAHDCLARDWLESHLILNAESILEQILHQPIKVLYVLEEPESTLTQPGPCEYQSWFPLPDELLKRFGFNEAVVGGKIWSYSHVGGRGHGATVSTLAQDLALSERTVNNAILVLRSHGYVKKVTTPFCTLPAIYTATDRMGSFEIERIIEKTPQGDSTIDFDSKL